MCSTPPSTACSTSLMSASSKLSLYPPSLSLTASASRRAWRSGEMSAACASALPEWSISKVELSLTESATTEGRGFFLLARASRVPPAAGSFARKRPSTASNVLPSIFGVRRDSGPNSRLRPGPLSRGQRARRPAAVGDCL